MRVDGEKAAKGDVYNQFCSRSPLTRENSLSLSLTIT
jgi:hypothetical protein